MKKISLTEGKHSLNTIISLITKLADCLVRTSVVSLITFFSFSSAAQTQPRSHAFRNLEKRDLIDLTASLLNLGDSGKLDRSNRGGHVLFSIIPIAPSNQSGGVAVSAINASFYLGQESNISSIYFYPFTNFAGSYGIILLPNIWVDHNRWNATGEFRFIQNELIDYGLGNSPKVPLGTVEFTQIRTYLTAYSKIKGYFYAGTGYNLDYFYNIKDPFASAIDPSDPLLVSRTHYTNYSTTKADPVISSGLTANILRDNRKNSINPTSGFYYNAVFRVNVKEFGSTTTWTSFYADMRRHISFSDTRHKVLAMRGMYWGTYGDVPYLNLPSTFQDPGGRAGRGFSANRFRGKQMLFAETEYRFDLTSHGFLGATVFANAQSFTEASGKFESIIPAAGTGLRIKFNRNSDTNIALDFSYAKDGFHFNMNLGEYF
jgi:hypothetical protein